MDASVLHVPENSSSSPFSPGDYLEGRRGLGEHCPRNAEQPESLRLNAVSWSLKAESSLGDSVLEMHSWSS